MRTQRTIGESLDDDPEHSADHHRTNQHCESASKSSMRKTFEVGKIVPGERSNHKYVAMRKIDEAQDTVNHGVTEGDERVNRSERKAVEKLL